MFAKRSRVKRWGKSAVLKDPVFRRIVERSTDAIVMHDSRGRILFANHAAAEALLEKSPEALTGQSIIRFFPGPKREKYAALMERTLESGKPFVDVEFPLASGEGEALIASVSGVAVDNLLNTRLLNARHGAGATPLMSGR